MCVSNERKKKETKKKKNKERKEKKKLPQGMKLPQQWNFVFVFFLGLLIFYIKADSLEYFIFLMKREVKFHNFL